jgi:hypothetical protein
VGFQDQFDELVRALNAEQEAKLSTAEEVRLLKERIRCSVRKWDSLSAGEKTRLADDERRLAEIQRTCGHLMVRNEVFTSVRLICSRCDWEDRTYRYILDPTVKKR